MFAVNYLVFFIILMSTVLITKLENVVAVYFLGKNLTPLYRDC